MRTLPALVACAVILTALVATPANAAEGRASNLSAIEAFLARELAKHNMQLPDLTQLAAHRVPLAGIGAPVGGASVPAAEALGGVLSGFDSIELEDLVQGSDAEGVPVVGNGNNVHLYLSLRLFDCSPKGYYTGWMTEEAVPPVGTIPNPTYPVVPIAGATVYGGPAFHVEGGGWLLGLHLFLGAPQDVNVNTASSIEGLPAGPLAAAGVGSTVDTVGSGSIQMFYVPVTIFGICLFSIDFGDIVENGSMGIDTDLVPYDPLME